MKKHLLTFSAAAAALALPLAMYAENIPTAHAYQMGSEANRWGYVEFPVNDISDLQIVKSTSSEGDQIGAGECVDGKIYAYTLYYDFLMGNGLEPADFVIIDAATFNQEAAFPTYGGGRVVDMAYDYTTNIMYALREVGTAENNGTGKTALHIVNLTNGELTLVGDPGDIRALDGYGRDVEEHLVALASDPVSGQLYAFGEYRQLYKLDSYSGLATPVGSRHRIAIMNDFQTMAFAANGNLYQCQCHPDHEYFMQINPENGELTNPVTGEPVTVDASFNNTAARFPDDPQLTALWFDGKTYRSNAAKCVTNLTAIVDAANPNKITISWTLPALNEDGTPATVTGVKIYRLGTAEALASLGADAVSFIDEAAPNGDVVYLVAAETAEGQGFPAWTQAFAGADQLNAVTSLQASLDGNQAVLEWDAPTSTVNDGYADYNAITYTIIRKMGSVETTLTTDAEGTSYVAELDGPGTYSFIVIPASCGIQGIPAESNEITLDGGIATLPYNCGFEDNDGGTLWTIVNEGDSSSTGWSIISGYTYQQYDGKFAQFKTAGSASFPANDWLISPPIDCPEGEYELSFMANGASFDNHTFGVFIGPDSEDPADFSKRVYYAEDEKIYNSEDVDNHFTKITVQFTLNEDGAKRIAFQGIGCAIYATLKIDAVSLKATRLTGVEAIDCSEDGEAAYYNLQGQRIQDPAGACIRIQNGKATKIFIQR